MEGIIGLQWQWQSKPNATAATLVTFSREISRAITLPTLPQPPLEWQTIGSVVVRDDEQKASVSFVNFLREAFPRQVVITSVISPCGSEVCKGRRLEP